MKQQPLSGDADTQTLYEGLLRERPSSVAFARLTMLYLEVGMPAGALHLALEGVRHNPNYVSGWLALSRAYAAHGNHHEAREALARAAALYPSNQAFDRLRIELGADEPPLPELHFPEFPTSTSKGSPGPLRHTQRHAVSRQVDIIPGMERYLNRTEEDAETSVPDTTRSPADPDSATSVGPQSDDTIASELERLAQALESARIPSLQDQIPATADDSWTEEHINLHSRPATETMAEIYVGQGQLEEAIELYLSLCARNPEKQDQYISRIADLRRTSDGT